jgi:hypothetical protein
VRWDVLNLTYDGVFTLDVGWQRSTYATQTDLIYTVYTLIPLTHGIFNPGQLRGFSGFPMDWLTRILGFGI